MGFSLGQQTVPQGIGRGGFCLAEQPHGFNNRAGEFAMSTRRYGVEGGKGAGGQHLPFARAVEAAGWLYVSGQVPMANGELVAGNILAQSRQAIVNLIAILNEAGYGPEHVVRCGVWLEDARDFSSFNAVFQGIFRRASSGPLLCRFKYGR